MGKVPPIRRWRYCLREQKTQLLCRATYLLVQAYQHVWLGCHHDVYQRFTYVDRTILP